MIQQDKGFKTFMTIELLMKKMTMVMVGKRRNY